MQLDHPQIPIRSRSFADILDLSTHVVVRFWRPWLLTLAAGAIPLSLLNAWILRVHELDVEIPDSILAYLSALGGLIFVQAPLGCVGVSAYVGRALFIPVPHWKDILNGLGRVAGPLVWYLVCRRGVLLVVLMFVWAPFLDAEGQFTVAGFLIFLGLCLGVARGARPYLPEIIVLEQLPMRSRGSNSMTIRSRSKSLHKAFGDVTFARWLISVGCSLMLLFSIYSSIRFVTDLMFFGADVEWFLLAVVLPIVCWLIAGFMAVVRFLAYIDLRIHREGWEVELLFRAAAEQLAEMPARRPMPELSQSPV